MELKNLKKIYIGCIAILILLVILTPLLISDGLFIIGEEPLETISIATLIFVGIVIKKLYEKELISRENYLQEAWGHIGEINLLTEAFKNALVNVEKYPESKQEMKNLLIVIADKILGMVNCQFIMIRIILTDENKVLSEHIQFRENSPRVKISISNNEVTKGKHKKYEIIASSASNSRIKSFCIFSKTKISEEQRIFIQKIANDLTMLFIIFNSEFYKK